MATGTPLKNVTITMEESVAEWARLEAARRNTSVSKLVGEMLTESMRRDDAYERAHQDFRRYRATWRSDGSPYPSRDELYAQRLDRFGRRERGVR